MKKCKKVLTVGVALVMTSQVGWAYSNGEVKNLKKSILDNVTRISGSDRYETANKISEKFNLADTVVIASGINFPDALCAAPLAKKTNSPILLSKKDSLVSSTIKEIKRLKASRAIIVGGKSSVGENVVKQLKDNGLSVYRIYGQNRYETSVEIAKHLSFSTEVAIASGTNFADALSISEIAAQKQMPILLSSKNKLSSNVDSFIKNMDPNKTYVIGGESSLSKNIINQVPGPIRLAGADRYKTNAVVNNKFKTILDFHNIYLASGKVFPDALAGAPLAAKKNQPLVLIGNYIDFKTRDLLKDMMESDSEVSIFGGENTVSDKVAKDFADNILSSGDEENEIEKKTVVVKNSTELKKAIEDTSISKIDLADNYTNTSRVHAVRHKNGSLTINFRDEKDIRDLKIEALELEKLTLNDDGLDEIGAEIESLTINTPKAHVINNVKTHTLNVEDVSTATLVQKDKVINTLNMNGGGVLDIYAENSVKTVNIGSEAENVKITGSDVDKVNAKSSIEINNLVNIVNVPSGVVGVKIFGSGNLNEIQTSSPIVVKSTKKIERIISKSDLILDSNVGDLYIKNDKKIVNVSGKAKIHKIKTKSNLNLDVGEKVDIVESDKKINLNSPVGLLIPKSNININTNSVIDLINVNSEGYGSSLNGSGIVNKLNSSGSVLVNIPVKQLNIIKDSKIASISGVGDIGKVIANSVVELNVSDVGLLEIPKGILDVIVTGKALIEKASVNESVSLNVETLRVDIPKDANDITIYGVGSIKNINTMKNLTIKSVSQIDSIVAKSDVNIKIPYNSQTKVYKSENVEGNVNLTKGFNVENVNDIVVKEPEINLSEHENSYGIFVNPNEEDFEDVSFTIPKEEGTTYYYTLDDSNPNDFSNEYNGEVVIDSGNSYDKKIVTIKVIGIKDGEMDSPIASKEVIFNTYNKKDPIYQSMESEKVKKGNRLSFSNISGAFNTQGNLEWISPNEQLKCSGFYMWKFIPDENKMFNEIRGSQYIEVY